MRKSEESNLKDLLMKVRGNLREGSFVIPFLIAHEEKKLYLIEELVNLGIRYYAIGEKVKVFKILLQIACLQKRTLTGPS